MEHDKILYKLNDDILFRKCDLFDENIKHLGHGDCTEFYTQDEFWKTYYYCQQYGIHFHCPKHQTIELDLIKESAYETILECPKCKNPIRIDGLNLTIKKCLKALNSELFKSAKLVRLDDYYTPEIKKKEKINSNYWMTTDIKKDKDGDTIIVLYVGNKNTKEKSQFFIKPEKLQLTSDHKDLDPATILSKIEVTLKDRKLIHEFNKE